MSNYSRFIGTGSYYPSDVRTNADLEQMVDTSDEWITDRTGIKERRIIGADETAATMGAEASKKAIEMAEVQVKCLEVEVDLEVDRNVSNVEVEVAQVEQDQAEAVRQELPTMEA